MADNLKYNPSTYFQEHRDQADALDAFISYRIESVLEDKIRNLMGQLIESNDDKQTDMLHMEIKNVQKDLEDLKVNRDLKIKKLRERNIW